VNKLDDLVAELVESGYEVVQQGKVVVPYDPNTKPKLSFAERIEHPIQASFIQSGDKLFDDNERWFHLRPPAEDVAE
jgi:hypothetical protein